MKAPEKPKHKRDEKISKVIDKVLRQIFGHEARFLLYEYLESRHSLKQDEIVEKIDVFARGLEEYLDSGAYVVEKKILEEIYPSYGSNRILELEERRTNKIDFADQIRMLRKRV